MPLVAACHRGAGAPETRGRDRRPAPGVGAETEAEIGQDPRAPGFPQETGRTRGVETTKDGQAAPAGTTCVTGAAVTPCPASAVRGSTQPPRSAIRIRSPGRAG